MGSISYGYSTPQCVEGPVITSGKGPSWDRAEATFLCPGNRALEGGFKEGQPFPDAPGFVIDTIASASAGTGKHEVRLSGIGVKKVRVYCARNSYTSSQVESNIEVGGVPYSLYNPAWPQVDLLLNGEGFRQIIVGATSILGDVGQKVAAPQVGGFPNVPQNPWTEIDEPTLNFPWGWVIARRDAEPLTDGPYSSGGPWILTTEYAFRWKLRP